MLVTKPTVDCRLLDLLCRPLPGCGPGRGTHHADTSHDLRRSPPPEQHHPGTYLHQIIKTKIKHAQHAAVLTYLEIGYFMPKSQREYNDIIMNNMKLKQL